MGRFDAQVTRVLRPLALVWFVIVRIVRHEAFLRSLGLSGARRWLFPAYLVLKAGNVLSRCWQKAFTEIALGRYADALTRHYGPEGLAYSHLVGQSDEDRCSRFHAQRGRIRYLLDDRRIVDFADGDSFLDCGCGPGQNVAELRRAFPRSRIKAFDYNTAAVEVIKAATAADPTISVEQGDLTDPKWLAGYADGSFDHVLMSHVIGFLLRPTLEETCRERQRLVDEMIRIAARSVVILDANEAFRRPIRVEIEQRDRAAVHDDLCRYFEAWQSVGKVYLAPSPEGMGLVFRKNAALTAAV